MKRIPCLVLLISMLAGGVHAAIKDWLEDVAKRPTPEFADAPPAVILLDETVLDIDEHGKMEEVHRYAFRLLHLGSRDLASGEVWYNGKSDKVTHAEACVWRAGRAVKNFSLSDWADLADYATGAVVDERRKKIVDCSQWTVVGDVFASETRVKSPCLFGTIVARFGSLLPVLVDRRSLTVPPGFKIRSMIFGPNPPAENRTPDGLTCVWTETDRPFRREEPLPGRGAYIDAEVFAFIEPPDGRTGFAPKQFRSWGEVAAWDEQLNSDNADASPDLIAKVRNLTAGCTDQLSKIRAIAAYVQTTRYLAINRNLAIGMGYRARNASVVFSTGFGDCKDKANLMRTMLREAGIRAYMVGASVGRDLDVRPEAPTPIQFDHVIVGIEVGPEIALPSVVEAGKLGRLLIFDPTNRFITVGDLSPDLQAAWILVSSRDTESLIETPKLAPEAEFGIERTAEITLLPKGVAHVAARVTAGGFIGAAIRRQFKDADTPRKLEELVAGHLSDSFKGALVEEKSIEDDATSGRIRLSFSCVNKGLVQPLPGDLAVIKLDVLDRNNLPAFPEKERHVPVRLLPLHLEDTITLHIPHGMRVDELPPASTIESPYGHYQIAAEVSGDTVVVHRKVFFNWMEMPAAEYAALKAFLGKIAKADRCSVILNSGG